MDAVTYPNEAVIEHLSENVVSMRAPHDADPLSLMFNVRWTPSFHIVDPEGRQHQMNKGFLPPLEFIPWILMGRGRSHFDRSEFDQAAMVFDRIETEYPKSHWLPEVVYWGGVTEYKKTGDPQTLRRVHEKLEAHFPESLWKKKASPYRLL